MFKKRHERLLRKAQEQRQAHRQMFRIPLDQLDPITRELVEIGQKGAFLQRYGVTNERTRQLGQLLYKAGGKEAMLEAHRQVESWVPEQARALEMAWDGIGQWWG